MSSGPIGKFRVRAFRQASLPNFRGAEFCLRSVLSPGRIGSCVPRFARVLERSERQSNSNLSSSGYVPGFGLTVAMSLVTHAACLVSDWTIARKGPNRRQSSLTNLRFVKNDGHKTHRLSPVLKLAQYLKSVANTFERDFRARTVTKHPYALSEGARRKTAGPVLCRFRRSRAGASYEPSLISGRQSFESN